MTYTYDGDGKRVKKSNGTLYFTGPGADALLETDLSGNATAEYVFFGGKRVARVDQPAGTVEYYFSDHLGSMEVVTNATGGIVKESDYLPYGSEVTISGTDPNHYKFTGKERDSESGLDNFGARYDASSIGRFMTPDPIAGVLANPQSLNKYAYVLNRPLVLTDPTGMIVDWNDSKKSKKDGKTNAQRAFEKRLEQLNNSKNAADRAKGAGLQKTYDRLQASKATFEVVKPDSTGESRGDLRYDGNNHFTVNLKGDMTNAAGFTDNQKLAHEFEHGRQVLDGELSYKLNSLSGSWDPFAHDLTDEANGFAAGFSIEGATPGQGSIINGAATALTNGGVPGEASYLGSHIEGYRGLPAVQLNVPNPPPPGVYEVPK